jgi:hypothetical protein
MFFIDTNYTDLHEWMGCREWNKLKPITGQMLNAEKALTNNNLFRTLLPESGISIICIEKDFSKAKFLFGISIGLQILSDGKLGISIYTLLGIKKL